MGEFVSGGFGRLVVRACALALALGLTVEDAWAQVNTKPPARRDWVARVSYVIDGDSLWVRPEGSTKRRKLRLYGIDAPEICQPYGGQAKTAMGELVRDQPVRVQVRSYDRYGRAIATVHRISDDLDIAGAMVVGGWAWNTAFRGRKGLYWREEVVARQSKKGLFAQAQRETPGEFRARHGPCKSKP